MIHPVFWGALLTLCIYFFEALVGLILSCFKRTHRLGIRLLAMNPLCEFLVPRLCRSRCDRSCGNWTCPKFHED